VPLYWHIISHCFWFAIINSSCNHARRDGLNHSGGGVGEGGGVVWTVGEEMRHHSHPQRDTVHGSRSSTVSGNPVGIIHVHNIIYELPRRVAYIIISHQYLRIIPLSRGDVRVHVQGLILILLLLVWFKS